MPQLLGRLWRQAHAEAVQQVTLAGPQSTPFALNRRVTLVQVQAQNLTADAYYLILLFGSPIFPVIDGQAGEYSWLVPAGSAFAWSPPNGESDASIDTGPPICVAAWSTTPQIVTLPADNVGPINAWGRYISPEQP